MALAQKLEQDNLRLVCQRSVEELHQLFVAWFQGTTPRESLTQSLQACLAPEFSHVAPNGQFLQGRNILIGHLQDKYGCYKNRLFQIEIYDVQLLWNDANKCLCTYEEWQSWLPDNAQQLVGSGGGGPEAVPNSMPTDQSVDGSEPSGSTATRTTTLEEVHQFGRLSTCLLERKDNKYRWIHVHETWLEAESPQHSSSKGGSTPDAASFMGEDTVMTGPVPRSSHHATSLAKNLSTNSMLGASSFHGDDTTGTGDDSTNNLPSMEADHSSSTSASSSPRAAAAALPARVPPSTSLSAAAAPPPRGGGMAAGAAALVYNNQNLSDSENQDSTSRGAGTAEPLLEIDTTEVEDTTHNADEMEDDYRLDDSESNTDRHLLMLLSTQSLSRDQRLRQDEARNILEMSGIAFYEMDGANPEERENRNALFQLSGQWGRYPQFFLVDTAGSTTFWGDWDYFWHLHSTNQLTQRIGGNNNVYPTPMSDSNHGPSPASGRSGAESPPSTATTPQHSNVPEVAAAAASTSAAVATTAAESSPATSDQQQPGEQYNFRVLVLLSSQTLSRDQAGRQDETLAILQKHGIPHFTLDGSNKDSRERRNQLFRHSTLWGKYPQLFVLTGGEGVEDDENATTTFWGTHDELQKSVTQGTVVEDLTPSEHSSSHEAETETEGATTTQHTGEDEDDEGSLGAAETAAITGAPVPALTAEDVEMVDKKKSNGSSSSTPPEIQFVLLISQQTLSKEQVQRQEDARKYLSEALESPNQMRELDGSSRDNRHERNELFKVSQLWGRYPQLFLQRPKRRRKRQREDSKRDDAKEEDLVVFWGDWETMESSYQQGTFRQDLERVAAAFALPAEGEPDDDDDEDDDEDAHNANLHNSLSLLNGAPAWAITGGVAPMGAAAALEMLNSDDDQPQVLSPEQEFMERSQGILEFEYDEEDTGNNEDTTITNGSDQIMESTAQPAASAAISAAPVTPSSSKKTSSPKQKGDPSVSAAVVPTRTATEEEQRKFELVMTMTESPIPQDVSSKRHVSSKLLQYAKPLTWENSLVGLSVNGFDIGTSQGPEADDTWYQEVTAALETVAQYQGASTPRRQLTLPQHVFPTAHVALEGHGYWLSWDVLDALEEWARAHEMIEIYSNTTSSQGVHVLKQSKKLAAALERNRRRQREASSPSSKSSPSVFHYDWSYSTPFCGKVEGGEWVELDESGMRVELLTDTSVPILFFDEITLFHDDLGQHGQVQLTVKLRVMPTCAYVLARLWTCIDHVLVRVRETRLLADFFGMSPAVYRDVTWRECAWDQLSKHDLPTDVSAWRVVNGHETPAWQAQLRQIPQVPEELLPESVFRFATLEPNQTTSRHVVKQLNSSVAQALGENLMDDDDYLQHV